MNKDIHCLKKWGEVILFNNEIFYTPPDRFFILSGLKAQIEKYFHYNSKRKQYLKTSNTQIF